MSLITKAAMAALPLALLPLAAAAQAMCYAYAPKEGALSPVAELTYTTSGIFEFTLPGAPYAVFSGACPLDENGQAECQVECDGGRVRLQQDGETLQITFEYLRVETLRMESLAFGLVQWEADGLQVTGDYLLSTADPLICTELASRVQPLALEPGDFYPAVERIEKALARSGHFTGVPDWLFTKETAEAVALFRQDAGLAAEGPADRALLHLLGVQVTYGGGGC